MVTSVAGPVVGLSTPENLYPSRKYQSWQGAGTLAPAAPVGGTADDSSHISGPGRLYSDLEQLRAADPAKFQRVVTAIAGQVQAAAQQAGTASEQGTFLTRLAARFESVAGGGDLSQLQPRRPSNRVAAAYAVGGTDSSPSLLNLGRWSTRTNAGSAATSGAVDVQQLFTHIANEVSQALPG